MTKRIQFLIDIAKLFLYADSNNIKLICFDFDRSQAEQDKNVLSGKSWTTHSRHLIWQAMDLAVVEEGNEVNFSNDTSIDYSKYELLGNYWEKMGPEHIWGAGMLSNGKRRDVYHFEIK